MLVALVLFSVFVDETVYGIMANVTPIAAWVILIFGTYVDMKILTDGVSSIGVGAHWWIAAPSIVTAIAAILPTVKEVVGY